MRPLKSLTFDSVISLLSASFLKICDRRDPAKVKYALHDVLMSGFAMMFFHHPSLLQFQERMKEKRGRCNLETLFQVKSVPSDTQMREILDDISPESLRTLLPKMFEKVRRAGWAEQYKTSLPSGKEKGSYYTMALDGMEYFHSTEIQCSGCLKKEDSKSGQTSFSHCVVGATLVKAGSHRIFPLDVEEVRNTDGQKKQDCELNAGKRLTERIRKEHPQLPLIVLGDDLYSHEPFVQSLIEKRMHFVLVAKPDSHKEMIEWVEDLDRQGECVKGTWEEGAGGKRRIYEYRIAEIVPLKAGGKVGVNYIEVWERDQKGKLLYHNSWVTDLNVDAENIAVVVRIGRSRWKIENEQFNIHKNHGYNVEHNYGHGKKNLSIIFYILNLLAFITHLILELGDPLYQKLRERDTIRESWNALRILMGAFLYESWIAMLSGFLDEEESSP
jgi:hypothetical protein